MVECLSLREKFLNTVVDEDGGKVDGNLGNTIWKGSLPKTRHLKSRKKDQVNS
jgi:hypothetical protein